MKTVLVTGATGFIGRHTLEPLVRRGFDVHFVYRAKRPEIIPDERGATWHRVDLLNDDDVKDLFNSFSPAYLLHLAWDVTPGSYLESINNFTWLDSSLHLLREFAESGGVRAVCAGTCIEYDVRYGYCTEDLTPTLPSTYYGQCKHHLRSIGERYADKMGFELAWGRIFQPYGPYEYPARLVPSVIRSLLNGEPARCTHGNQIRDFLYVADVADAFAALLDSGVTGCVNIGSGEPVSIRELVMQIAHHLGKEDDVRFGALPAREDESPFIVADIGRLIKEVQWRQRYSLEKGVMETISWWKKMGVQG
ncbi:MAG TPA: NAD(P)-dependent oxidoreductase [Methanoregulaceae archaeon]|jgi:nucleoside-diphosphate-sugar epimerase|nr:NAD(P)-dependent oxidoreductase [Methanoregulaceae archaeon]